MAYCTITDIRGVNPKRTYSDTSKPTLEQVEEYVSQIAAEIDSVLQGRGVSTPVTAPSEFATSLKKLNAQGAGALAEMAMFPEAVGTPGGTPHGQYLWKMYQQGLSRLEKGNLPAGLAASSGGAESFFSEHGEEGTEPEPSEQEWAKPKFRKNKEF